MDVEFLNLCNARKTGLLYKPIRRRLHRTRAEGPKFGSRLQTSFLYDGWLDHPAKDAVTLHKSGRRSGGGISWRRRAETDVTCGHFSKNHKNEDPLSGKL
jgi:hypothetical protein